MKYIRNFFTLSLLLSLAGLITVSVASAQDDPLHILVVDFMAESILSHDDLASIAELEIVSMEDFSSLALEYILSGEPLDLVVGPNNLISDIALELGESPFILTDIWGPEIIDPPIVISPICLLIWCQPDPPIPPEPDPICNFPLCPWPPCPPNALSCPIYVVVDVEFPLVHVDWIEELGIDPENPIIDVDTYYELLQRGNVSIDLSNGVGFELEPAFTFDNIAPENLVETPDEADLVVTVACNYVANIERYNELGLVPVMIEEYVPTDFSIGAYPLATSERNEDAQAFVHTMIQDESFQMTVYETTHLLPGNGDILKSLMETVQAR